MVAILPAAGKGTRMASVSAGPKELLHVGGRAVLERVIEEAQASGAEEIVIVVSPLKPELLELSTRFAIATQEHPTGLAPAILAANPLQPSLVLLPDTIFFPSSPTPRLVQAINRGYDIAVAVQRIPNELVSRYGIVEWNPESGRIHRILEKPQPHETASRWAIAARFALSTRSLLFVKDRTGEAKPGTEVDLPPLLDEAIAAGHTAIAVPLEADERRLDCGSPEGYRHACQVIDAAL